MAIGGSAIGVVHADAQRGLPRAEGAAPRGGEVALGPAAGVVEQADVRVSTSSGQNRGKTVNRDVDNFAGAFQIPLNGRGDFCSERAMKVAEEPLASLGREGLGCS